MTQKLKTCHVCRQTFQSRKGAKTCSDRCRKSLWQIGLSLAKQKTLKEASTAISTARSQPNLSAQQLDYSH